MISSGTRAPLHLFNLILVDGRLYVHEIANNEVSTNESLPRQPSQDITFLSSLFRFYSTSLQMEQFLDNPGTPTIIPLRTCVYNSILVNGRRLCVQRQEQRSWLYSAFIHVQRPYILDIFILEARKERGCVYTWHLRVQACILKNLINFSKRKETW